MKKTLLPALLAVLVLFSQCSPYKNVEGVWINKEKAEGKTFSKLFVVVLTSDLQARQKIENALAERATKRGLQVVKSIDAIPASLDKPAPPTKEQIIEKAEAAGCDGVLVAKSLKKEESVKYTPGSEAYAQGTYWSWQGNVTGYYTDWYNNVSTDNKFDYKKEYVIQSNLYDLKSKDLLWSVQSSVFNPSDINNFASKYTSALVGQLKKSKLIK